MTIDEMLKHRHTLKLTWSLPGPAILPDGTEFTAVVDYVATVHDCIGMARYTVRQLRGKMLDDETCLDYFIVNNYAQVQE